MRILEYIGLDTSRVARNYRQPPPRVLVPALAKRQTLRVLAANFRNSSCLDTTATAANHCTMNSCTIRTW